MLVSQAKGSTCKSKPGPSQSMARTGQVNLQTTEMKTCKAWADFCLHPAGPHCEGCVLMDLLFWACFPVSGPCDGLGTVDLESALLKTSVGTEDVFKQPGQSPNPERPGLSRTWGLKSQRDQRAI